MTRKDYEKIAEAISLAKTDAKRNYAESVGEGVEMVEQEISDMLSEDNPRFDADRFAEACKVKED